MRSDNLASLVLILGIAAVAQIASMYLPYPRERSLIWISILIGVATAWMLKPKGETGRTRMDVLRFGAPFLLCQFAFQAIVGFGVANL